MKYLSLLAGLALLSFTSLVSAQTRSLGAGQMVIDNGNGGKLTIIYNGVGDETLEIGNNGLGGAQFPNATSGQTLRSNGEGFDSSSTLFNTGTQVHIRGGLVYAVKNVSSSTQLTEGDHIVLAHVTNCNSVDITLPEPTAGRVITVRMIDDCSDCECQEGGGVTIYPYADESIDQWTDYTLFFYEPSVTFVSDGTNWWSIGNAFGAF